jgi:hypothetical protein
VDPSIIKVNAGHGLSYYVGSRWLWVSELLKKIDFGSAEPESSLLDVLISLKIEGH